MIKRHVLLASIFILIITLFTIKTHKRNLLLKRTTFIEGGEFKMLADTVNKIPQRNIKIEDFHIGTYEVTVNEFSKFISETGYITDADKNKFSWIFNEKEWIKIEGANWSYDSKGKIRDKSEYNHPVAHVSWNDAVAYCKWVGGRLPTQAE